MGELLDKAFFTSGEKLKIGLEEACSYVSLVVLVSMLPFFGCLQTVKLNEKIKGFCKKLSEKSFFRKFRLTVKILE